MDKKISERIRDIRRKSDITLKELSEKTQLSVSLVAVFAQTLLPKIDSSGNKSGRILAQSDRIMLNEYKGETIDGIYSFCYTLALPVSILVETLNTSWVPEFYALMKEGKTEEIHLHFGRQLFLVTAICCGYLLVVPEGLKLLAPVEYWKGMNILPLVIVGFFFSFIYFYPVNYELYHKKVKYSALCTTLAALLNIILNYLLIPKFEMVGASVATLIAFIFRSSVSK